MQLEKMADSRLAPTPLHTLPCPRSSRFALISFNARGNGVQHGGHGTKHKPATHNNRAALDVTESALLRPCFPGVKFLRIDGSVSQAERAAAVDRFSADASVAVLLLTTRVGHLGLNLSAASMVVFLEHDWNPQVDLQVRLLSVCLRVIVVGDFSLCHLEVSHPGPSKQLLG